MSEKPQRPGDYECCESGCEPCIWDLYFEELREWNEKQAAESKPIEAKSIKANATGVNKEKTDSKPQ